MRVYFVRHGLTSSLDRRLYQSPDDPLSPHGILQSQELASRLSSVTLDLVISSPYKRAYDTASMVSDDILVNDLFIETRRPSQVVGKSKDDSDVQKIIHKINDMFVVDSAWHYSDEENFTDLKTRGQLAIDFILSQQKQNILIVSHANFITFLIGLMVCGRDFNPHLSQSFKNFFHLDNTGISLCNLDNNQWHLQCWNNTSHCNNHT